MSKPTQWLTTAVTVTLMVTGGIVVAQSNTDTKAAHMSAARDNGDDGISSSINPGRDIGSTNNSRPGHLPIPPTYTVSPQASVTTETVTESTTVAATDSPPEMTPAPVAATAPSYTAAPETTVAASSYDSSYARPPQADRN